MKKHYLKITNKINTEVYDNHYTENEALKSFVSLHGIEETIKIYPITKQEYHQAIINSPRN